MEMTPMYNTILFTDMYEDAAAFLMDYKDCGIPITISDDSVNTLYYLMYAQYGNSPIANYDINQFKYKVFSIVFQYGPVWEKELEIQNKLVKLSDEELMTGSKQIYNHAYNPSTAPGTDTLQELTYIDKQNTSSVKRSQLDGYALLLSLLDDNITAAFLKRFKNLFKFIVKDEHPLLYFDGGDM